MIPLFICSHNSEFYIYVLMIFLLFAGKPNIISIYAENKAGSIGKMTFDSVIIDTTAPNQGVVICPEYVGVCL